MQLRCIVGGGVYRLALGIKGGRQSRTETKFGMKRKKYWKKIRPQKNNEPGICVKEAQKSTK